MLHFWFVHGDSFTRDVLGIGGFENESICAGERVGGSFEKLRNATGLKVLSSLHSTLNEILSNVTEGKWRLGQQLQALPLERAGRL